MAQALESWSEPVQRVLHWMMRQVSGQGVLTCPEHGMEHTGKNAGAVVMACELARLGVGDGEVLFQFALQQGLRIASRLEREGDSTCWTFRPGRHDPFNCSNSVIDGGACSDALGTLLQQFGDRLSEAQWAELQRACVLHAQTYLRYAAFDKGIPAQRAWALTGVSRAFQESGHEVLRFATVEGARAIFEAMHADGSFAYHPLDQNPGHVGASDVSAFYQSRPTAFLMFALDAVGENPAHGDWAEPLRKQLTFLAALYGPEGRKLGAIEAKPWYHGAEYEVASHPFDVYALARGARLFGDAKLGRCALASFRAWADHLAADGCPQSHSPGPGRFRSYQCATFWAGHSQWMARAIEDLAWIAEQDWCDAETPEPGITWFEQAQLARLEDERIVAWVRGACPANNLDHGSRVGAGLLRVVDRSSGEEWLGRDVRALDLEGEWTANVGSFSPARAWSLNREELRFSVWKARNARRTRGVLAAATEPLLALRHGWIGFAKGLACSAFDKDPRTELEGTGLVLEAGLCLRGGAPVPGYRVRREYRLLGQGLEVTETLLEGTLDTAKHYRIPAQARDVRVESASIRYRLG